MPGLGGLGTEAELGAVFAEFDTDRSGFIDVTELQSALGRAGKPVSKEEAEEILREVDTNADHQISFEEFEQVFHSTPDALPVGVRQMVDATNSILTGMSYMLDAAKFSNKNRPADYAWMEKLLSEIAVNDAPSVTDNSTNAAGSALFVMAGACPSALAGMQAVGFFDMGAASGRSGKEAVDFWWLKPRAKEPTVLEEQTLNRNGKGTHKNDPGASKRAYAPIANLFGFGTPTVSPDGKLGFGVTAAAPALGGAFGAKAGHGSKPRAYIDCKESGVRYWVVWVWQESWSSVVKLMGKKWMKGKLIYQREGASGRFFARPFKFVEGQGLLLPSGTQHEESVVGVIPGDQIKLNILP